MGGNLRGKLRLLAPSKKSGWQILLGVEKCVPSWTGQIGSTDIHNLVEVLRSQIHVTSKSHWPQIRVWVLTLHLMKIGDGPS